SIPAPGSLTLEFGGNTTCLEIIPNSGPRIVIDAGTGMRLLGESLRKAGLPVSFHLFLTHNHWDHLLGLPFFAPIYNEDTEIIVDGWPHAFQALTRVFDNHLGNGFFPVAFDQLKARIDFLNRVARHPLSLGGVTIDSIPLNHPQGGLGYRVREGENSLVFITDNELGAGDGRRFREFVHFAKGCNLLIHDAQYLPEEMAEHRGWGHSTYEEVVTLALEAGVKRLLLTHHDPGRSDDQVHQIVERARKFAASHGAGALTLDAAREGSSYHIP
ncbi:MAG: MBL fold metallo-hydrolase, partial [Deltaproteobacteria bacterium]|nr:MBL fold metallo-hydrolase [Deltaproteobacteria bacterium]